MERTFLGAVLIIFIAWLVGTLIYEAKENLKVWSRSCRLGAEDKSWRNLAIGEFMGAFVLAAVTALVVMTGFLWG